MTNPDAKPKGETPPPGEVAAQGHEDFHLSMIDPLNAATVKLERQLRPLPPLSEDEKAALREKLGPLMGTQDPRIRRMFGLDELT